MTDKNSMLRILQNSDSFFPGGALSISSGLEGLANDSIVNSATDVEDFVVGQLVSRWSTFDRVVVREAAKHSRNLDRLIQVDQIVEAQTLSEAARNGSRQTGRALLGVHVKLQTPGARNFQQTILDGKSPGHNCVVQGLVWSQTGIADEDMDFVSAHGFTVGLVSAALRLGLIGHIASQALISKCHETLNKIVIQPPADIDALSAFSPGQEISMMRHESMSNRLFIN